MYYFYKKYNLFCEVNRYYKDYLGTEERAKQALQGFKDLKQIYDVFNYNFFKIYNQIIVDYLCCVITDSNLYYTNYTQLITILGTGAIRSIIHTNKLNIDKHKLLKMYDVSKITSKKYLNLRVQYVNRGGLAQLSTGRLSSGQVSVRAGMPTAVAVVFKFIIH